jgi:hypothetical protein
MEVLGHIEGVGERENGSIEETMSRRDGDTARLKMIEAGPFFSIPRLSVSLLLRACNGTHP